MPIYFITMSKSLCIVCLKWDGPRNFLKQCHRTTCSALNNFYFYVCLKLKWLLYNIEADVLVDLDNT